MSKWEIIELAVPRKSYVKVCFIFLWRKTMTCEMNYNRQLKILQFAFFPQ